VTAKSHFKVGDVFSVPLDDDYVGYGQIVDSWSDSGGHFYFAIFDGVYLREETLDLGDALSRPVAILALSMDPLLLHGHWKVIGHHDVVEGLPWPAYKEDVSTPGAFEVVDHTGRLRRPATEEEVNRLPFRSVVAPIRLEKAFQALRGIVDWNAAYDSLRPVASDLTSDSLLSR
jgi:hypothetical protein